MDSTILLGDCLIQLASLEDGSVDSVVTDVPYGLGNHEPTLEEILAFLQGARLNTGGDFMGTDWEIPSVAVWKEVYRVLKPGGHVLSFGGTRSWDLISLGLRVAGFESRDTIAEDHPALRWVYGQGFPKNLDISKAIDKAAGAERERKVIGPYRTPEGGQELTTYNNWQDSKIKDGSQERRQPMITTPATPEAKKYEGWGTALKPSWEPILVFRKPLEGTVTKNVLKHGTGGLNIDGCRVGYADEQDAQANQGRPARKGDGDSKELPHHRTWGAWTGGKGRWPTNSVFTHHPDCRKVGDKKVSSPDEDGTETVEAWECAEGCPVRALDEQSGVTTNTRHMSYQRSGEGFIGSIADAPEKRWWTQETGTASRFFPSFEGQEPVDVPFRYVAKPSKKESSLDGEIQNDHITKKPLELMRWLVRLVTPPRGVVLDPYCGSGTTLHAAREEGMRYVGIEKNEHAYNIAKARMEMVEQQMASKEHQHGVWDLIMSDDFDEE